MAEPLTRKDVYDILRKVINEVQGSIGSWERTDCDESAAELVTYLMRLAVEEVEGDEGVYE